MSDQEIGLNYKPVILAIDDDADINTIVSSWLRDIDCEVISFTSSAEFLKSLKVYKPSLCIVDINLESPGIGFKLIETVRKVLGKMPPIIVYSRDSDVKGIAHAMDLGADDYVIKPSTKTKFLEKVESYIGDATLRSSDLKNIVPDECRQIKLLVEVYVVRIDEFSIKIRTPELLTKGCVVLLNSELISEISGENKPVLGTVMSNWVYPEDRTMGAQIEFDQSNEAFLAKVRTWLLSHQTHK